MNRNRVSSSDSLETIQDFLTFVEVAKQNPETDFQFWEELKRFRDEVAAIEDKPAKLSKQIKQWCKDVGITFDREELKQVRANIIQKQGQEIPKPLEGEKPISTGNKALIVEKVNQAIAENKNE